MKSIIVFSSALLFIVTKQFSVTHPARGRQKLATPATVLDDGGTTFVSTPRPPTAAISTTCSAGCRAAEVARGNASAASRVTTRNLAGCSRHHAAPCLTQDGGGAALPCTPRTPATAIATTRSTGFMTAGRARTKTVFTQGIRSSCNT